MYGWGVPTGRAEPDVWALHGWSTHSGSTTPWVGTWGWPCSLPPMYGWGVPTGRPEPDYSGEAVGEAAVVNSENQGDSFENDEEYVYVEVDVAAKLSGLALEALTVVAEAIRAAPRWLATMLSHVIFALQQASVCQKWVYVVGSDSLEEFAGRALEHVDELIRQQVDVEAPPLPEQALSALKTLQRQSTDVLLLACCRGIDPREFWCKGLPPMLEARLEAVIGPKTDSPRSLHLWGRIGNSKYHCFTEGLHRRGQRHRHRQRLARRYQRAAADNDAEDDAADATAAEEEAENEADSFIAVEEAAVNTAEEEVSYQGPLRCPKLSEGADVADATPLGEPLFLPLETALAAWANIAEPLPLPCTWANRQGHFLRVRAAEDPPEPTARATSFACEPQKILSLDSESGRCVFGTFPFANKASVESTSSSGPATGLEDHKIGAVPTCSPPLMLLDDEVTGVRFNYRL